MNVNFKPPLPIESHDIESRYLPQRYPFLLVDRVTAYEAGVSITAIKNVTRNEPFFQGHFPDHPIMPGVLIIEAMAQTAGVLGLITTQRLPSDGYMFLFAGADKARFKRKVIPGDTLVMTAEMLNCKRGIFKFQCKAKVDGKLAASVEILVAEQKVATL